MLAERTDYLSAGVHIGMKSCTKYLRRFVYKIRDDGLAVFNLRKVDARVAVAAHFLAGYENILVVSRKNSASDAIEKFAEITGAKAIAGRFSPGTLTNPSYREFFEPDVIVSIDPLVDENAVKEAKKKRIPVVAICDTFNESADIDLIIPANNNGKKSLAMIFMLLAREMQKKRGIIKEDSEFKYKLEDFGADVQAPVVEEKEGDGEDGVGQRRPAPAKSKKEGPKADVPEKAEAPREKPAKQAKKDEAGKEGPEGKAVKAGNEKVQKDAKAAKKEKAPKKAAKKKDDGG